MNVKKIAALLLMVVIILAMATTAYAESSYFDPVKVKIGVAGTGEFLLKAAGTNDMDFVDKIDIVGYGEFIQEYTEPGTYSYVLWGTAGINSTRYNVDVYVMVAEANPVLGKAERLEAQAIISNSDQEGDHKYPVAYYPTSSAVLDVTKTASGEGYPQTAKFEFQYRALDTSVEALKGKMPMPGDHTSQVFQFEVPVNGVTTLDQTVFHRAGTYVYEISEINTGEKNWTYDKNTFRIIYSVKEGERGLEITRYIQKNGKTDTGYVEFINTYKVPTKGDKGPIKTGDTSNLGMWGAILGVSGMTAAVAITVLARKRRSESQVQ